MFRPLCLSLLAIATLAACSPADTGRATPSASQPNAPTSVLSVPTDVLSASTPTATFSPPTRPPTLQVSATRSQATPLAVASATPPPSTGNYFANVKATQAGPRVTVQADYVYTGDRGATSVAANAFLLDESGRTIPGQRDAAVAALKVGSGSVEVVIVLPEELSRTPGSLQLCMYVSGNANFACSRVPYAQVARVVTPPDNFRSVNGLYVRVLSPANGDRVKGALNDKGVPYISVSVELTGTLLAGKIWPEQLAVWVDDQPTEAGSPIQTQQVPFREDFRLWLTPGKHSLRILGANPNTRSIQGINYPLSNPVTFTVAEMPSPPATARMTTLYRERFNLNLSAPVLSRVESADPAKALWRSVAFVGNTFYEIVLPDTGQVSARSESLNPTAGRRNICRPNGRYRMLVVFVDYGNTGITKATALASLSKATEDWRRDVATFSEKHGAAEPILQVETTGAFLSAGVSGKLLELQEIQVRTGIDIAPFDFVAQVDLDKDNTYGHAHGGLAGLAPGGCGPRTGPVDLWVPVYGSSTLDYDLSYTLLSHEFFHLFGWAHDWPCGYNIFFDRYNFAVCHGYRPPNLFGWEDIDGDGVVEILDPAPYGLK